MQPLVRLSDQLDSQLPLFVLLTIVRWLFWQSCCPLRHLLAKMLPSGARVAPFGTRCATFFLACLTSYVFFDAAANVDTIQGCQPHSIPRPLGIAAGVALACFLTTTRLRASTACILTFLSVRERNTLSTLSSAASFSTWARLDTPLLIATIAAASVIHAVVCESPTSAALSIYYSMWTAKKLVTLAIS